MKQFITLTIVVVFLALSPALAGEQGVNANRSGKDFEHDVGNLLADHGFNVKKHSGYDGPNTEQKLRNRGRIALLQPPFTTLYGSPGRSDFLLMAPELENDVWIETKRMSVSGSLDEKLPHMFLSALSAIPGRHVIIIMDGDGWREGGVNWIRAAAKDRRWKDFANYPDKRVDIMTPAEFQIWLNSTFVN